MCAIRMLGATVLALSVSSACAEPVFISPNSSGAMRPDSNAANNTANVTLTALTPPPASGGGGGGGALGWLELAALGGGLRLLQKLRERRAFRSHMRS